MDNRVYKRVQRLCCIAVKGSTIYRGSNSSCSMPEESCNLGLFSCVLFNYFNVFIRQHDLDISTLLANSGRWYFLTNTSKISVMFKPLLPLQNTGKPFTRPGKKSKLDIKYGNDVTTWIGDNKIIIKWLSPSQICNARHKSQWLRVS